MSGVRLLGAGDVREIAGRLGVRPTKRLGQNFVVEQGTVRQIAALAAMLKPATVQHILLDDLTRILGVCSLYAGPWCPRWRGMSRPQLLALPSNRLGDLIADHLQAGPPGALECWSCSLLFDQLTAVAFARIGSPPADWPKARDLRTWFHEHASTLRALPPIP